jgi:hypothetical protein
MLTLMCLFSLLEIVPLWKKKLRKEMAAIFSCVSVAILLPILYRTLKIDFNPMNGLVWLFRPVANWIDRIFM